MDSLHRSLQDQRLRRWARVLGQGARIWKKRGWVLFWGNPHQGVRGLDSSASTSFWLKQLLFFAALTCTSVPGVWRPQVGHARHGRCLGYLQGTSGCCWQVESDAPTARQVPTGPVVLRVFSYLNLQVKFKTGTCVGVSCCEKIEYILYTHIIHICFWQTKEALRTVLASMLSKIGKIRSVIKECNGKYKDEACEKLLWPHVGIVITFIDRYIKWYL